MKSLLSMLGILSLSASTVAPLFNQNITELAQSNQQAQAIEFYWLENHRELAISADWYNTEKKVVCFIWEINIGETEVSDYKTFSIIDENNGSTTKTTWGSSEYLGIPFRSYQNKEIEEFFYKGQIWSDEYVYLKSTMVLLEKEDASGLASMATKQKVGLSYYTHYSGDNYLEVFAFMYAESWMSWSGGKMSLNLGQGIRLEP